MKPLYWTRIQLTQPPLSTNSDSIWEVVEDVILEAGKLEEMFGKADLKSKPKEEKEVKKPDKVAKIIDGKKSQNVGIFLRSKKIDVDMVKQEKWATGYDSTYGSTFKLNIKLCM